MPKLKIEDDVDVRPNIKIKNVPNPHLVYQEIKTLLVERVVFKEDTIDEKLYEHTKTGDVENIKSIIEAYRFKDKFSKITYKIKIDMKIKPVHKGDIKYVGDVAIELGATIETEYPQETPLQRSIVWDAFRAFYEKTIYKDVKEGYKQEAAKKLIMLKNEIQSFFDLLPKMVK